MCSQRNFQIYLKQTTTNTCTYSSFQVLLYKSVEAWTAMLNAILGDRWFAVLDGGSNCFRVIERNSTNTCMNLCFFLIHVVETLCILLPIIYTSSYSFAGQLMSKLLYSKSSRPSYCCLFSDLAFEMAVRLQETLF